jgi:hypothetical protein
MGALGDRVKRVGARIGGALLAGAGFGFVARDLVGLGGLSVAVAWGVGVLVAVLPDRPREGEGEVDPRL